jgi:flagellar hook-associated protein 1 FlgK
VSLSVALTTARSSLLSTAARIAVSSSNVANADDPTRTRKIALPTTGADGSAHVVTITRATDLPLFYRLLGSTATTAGSQALLDGLIRLNDTIGDPANGTSPAARIAALETALQAYANAPTDRGLAQAALSAGQAVVGALNGATATVTSVRDEADAAMAESVSRLNGLLDQFTEVDQTVVRKTIAGEDVTDALDKRDALLGQISKEIGITVVQRENNDVAIYTDGGVTLFDKMPRSVSFESSSTLAPGAAGNPITIDGVPVTGDGATMPIRSGNLAGLATLRDEVAPSYQAQLDELARGLVEAFAESDQSGGGGTDRAGLFTWSGGPGLPAAALSPGIAGSITVNAAVDPSKGGSLDRLRDGGINGIAYLYNATGAASYGTRLNELVAGLGAARGFDAAAGLDTSTSLLDFGTASVGWLENRRQTASDSADYQEALLGQVTTALSNASGVNIDDEYALQLQLEQSYQASSKLLTVVNSMFQTLLNAV